jgi:hypothetical protein
MASYDKLEFETPLLQIFMCYVLSPSEQVNQGLCIEENSGRERVLNWN